MRDDNDDDDDDDAHSMDGQQVHSQSSSRPAALSVGGPNLCRKPAFCVLDGIQDDDGSRVTFPIHRLPATLGRTLEGNIDKNFVGMGAHKFLSRQHVTIQYLIPTAAGGCGQIQSKAQKPGEQIYFNTDDPVKADEIQLAGQTTTLPDTGFFAITCLGKNKITVNGKRIEQGQNCMLEPGAAVRLGGFALYFLTPANRPTGTTTTMEVRDDVAPSKKRRISLGGGAGGAAVSTALKPAVAKSGAAIAQPAKKGPTLQAELDDLPTKELLAQMRRGIEDNIWDRRMQLIGSTLSYRAVLSATRSAELQKVAAENSAELSRGEIMDWIAESDRFRFWVDHMLSKMEAKSYQQSITKALIRAGFERTSSHGLYIKWTVPPDIFKPPTETEKRQQDDEVEEEADEDSDDDDASDQGADDQDGVNENEADGTSGEEDSDGSDRSGEEDGDNEEAIDSAPDEPDSANEENTAIE